MRNEYPRPELVRDEWLTLNGSWDFYLGDRKLKIEVPFVCQSELSGIGERITEDFVVYERTFTVPQEWKNRRILLHFGAVNYQCKVFVNEKYVGGHTGGQTPFALDVTESLNWGTECVRVEVENWLCEDKIARGKQFWEPESKFIWYTPSTGIWQSVWLEPVEETRFERVHFTPDIDAGTVRIDYTLARTSCLPCTVDIAITKGDEKVFQGSMLCDAYEDSITIDIFHNKAMNGSFHFIGAYWSPEDPVLYDVEMTVIGDDDVSDWVQSYFGMRKIEVRNGRLYLNNRPYYQKLVLDQGYWRKSLMTAPTDEDFVKDITMCKEMGFNGCRKHEKVEDPRFLYWADKLGFLVWEAMASFWSYTPQAASAFQREWMDVIERDYNHPCIVVWGMLNESWGVPGILYETVKQSFAKSLYYMAKALDGTRPVISNDGWETVDSDICAVHSYKHGAKDDVKQQEKFVRCLKSMDTLGDLSEKLLFADGTTYQGQPVVLSEYGGISIAEGEKGWGYTSVGKESFLEEYRRVTRAIYESDLICGFCYTQLTDIEQEVNGLLTYDHEYKFDPEEIKKIQDEKRTIIC